MTDLTILTASSKAVSVLPALSLLPYRTRVLALKATSITKLSKRTIVFVDATKDFDFANSVCQIIADTSPKTPTILVVTEEGMKFIHKGSPMHDFVLENASSTEVSARIRFAQRLQAQIVPIEEKPPEIQDEHGIIRVGDLALNTKGFRVTNRGVDLDFSYKEFELFKYLVVNAGKVCTRTQLLFAVWGYDYYGGTRTVDVHIRRLRSKLGVEYEQYIDTVRNVGYRFEVPNDF